MVDVYGPFKVANREVNTGILVKEGDVMVTLSIGLVDMKVAGISPLDADGEPALDAAGLRQFSLICKVGTRYYQGGITSWFVPEKDGELYLRANDDHPEDNIGEWKVIVEKTQIEGNYVELVDLKYTWFEMPTGSLPPRETWTIIRKETKGTADAANNTDTVVTSNTGGTTETVVTTNGNTSTVVTTNKGGTTTTNSGDTINTGETTYNTPPSHRSSHHCCCCCCCCCCCSHH